MAYVDTVLAYLPIHYWRLNEGPGATAALDLGSAPVPLWPGFQPSSSAITNTMPGLGFSGITADGGGFNPSGVIFQSLISSTASSGQGLVPVPDPGTLEFWAYLQDSQGGLSVGWVNPSLSAGVDQHGIFCINTAIAASTFSGITPQQVGVFAGQWNHVAISWATGGGFLYVNGTQAQPFSASPVPTPHHVSFYLGNWSTLGGAQNSHGFISEVAIYSTALTVGNLDTHFDAAELKTFQPTWKPLTVALPAAPGPPVASYSVGVTHVARTGAGVITVPTGLRGILATIQAGVPTTPELPGTPPYEWNVGWMTISDANGMLAQVRLTRQKQIWLPDNFALGTSLGYYLNPGFTVDFAELDPL